MRIERVLAVGAVGAVALALAACNRRAERNEELSTNETLFVLPPPVPNTEPQVETGAKAPEPEPPANDAKTEAKAEAKAEGKRAMNASAPKAKTAKRATSAASAAQREEPQAKAETSSPSSATSTDESMDARGGSDAVETPVGTATITSVVIVPLADATEKPAEGASGSEAPRGAGAEGYVNHSTTLGTGQSGMYTGGQGTYGGRATWGTGAGSR